MCGIAGIVGGANEDCGRIVVEMTQALAHRGPNDEGFWHSGPAWLGHRRLSIIDTSPAGHQPMLIDEGGSTHAIVFNGEIYNHAAVRQHALKEPHKCKTRSDTEVLLRLLIEQPLADALAQLHGMFAFAWWDSSQRRLVLVRDRLGVKPLYYHFADGVLTFSSGLDSLLRNPGVPRVVSLEGLECLVTLGYSVPPLTMYEGVHELPPAHFLVWQDGTIRVERYWQIDWYAQFRGTEEEAAEQLSSLLDDVVRDHLVSDVPVGAFLSGGLDSSTVVARASRMVDEPLKAFTISFPEQSYDESGTARLVADHLGVRHTVIPMASMAVDEAACRLVLKHVGQPFVDSSCLPSYLVARTASQHVKVVLSGDGGDELFAGYNEFEWGQRIAAIRAVPAGLRRLAARILTRFRQPEKLAERARQLRKAIAYSFDTRGQLILHLKSVLDPEEIAAFTDAFGPGGPALRSVGRELEAGNGLGLLTALSRFATNVALPGDMLRKVDSMSMASSLEVRVPLLDHRLVEFAQSLPMGMKMQGRLRKALLRRVMKKELPRQAFENPKSGFSIPLHRSFSPAFLQFCRETLLATGGAVQGLFGRKTVEDVLAWNEAPTNPVRQRWSSYTLSHTLWMMIQLEVWWHDTRVSGADLSLQELRCQ